MPSNAEIAREIVGEVLVLKEYVIDRITAAIDAAVAQERERCARIATKWSGPKDSKKWGPRVAVEIAAAIRGEDTDAS